MEELGMSYSIGINVVPESCLDDLNALLKIIVPIAGEMPWSHWVSIMYSGTDLITCFDDEKDQVIGMTSVVYMTRPTGNFADICDTAILQKYRDSQIESRLIIRAASLIQEKGFILL